MGWLFGKKRIVPKVPFPGGHSGDEGTLRFPSYSSSEKVIEPEDMKEAAGIEDEAPPLEMAVPKKAKSKGSFFRKAAPEIEPQRIMERTPHYIKIEVYREILGELDRLKNNLAHLQNVTGHLQSSEYNEESRFIKLRRAMRAIHDRLLQVDKILFKGE